METNNKLREALSVARMFVKESSMVSGRDLLVNDGKHEPYVLTPKDALKKIDAALAAPPRNCDIARDWMRDLYAHFKPPASVKREMPPEWVDAVMAFCRWLVAPAKEKEGGNNGNE